MLINLIKILLTFQNIRQISLCIKCISIVLRKNVLKIIGKITLFWLPVPQGSRLQVWSLPAQDPGRPHPGLNTFYTRHVQIWQLQQQQ